ncbi:MAG TPA: hypothetical protein VJJ22_01085 [Candidatus Paceibacterota bacterium]
MRRAFTMREDPRYSGRWKRFRVLETFPARYSFIVNEKGKPGLKERLAVAMCSGEDIVIWYPVKGDGLIDCKLLSQSEKQSVKKINGSKERTLLAELRDTKGKPKRLQAGMHPVYVRCFKKWVQPLLI